MGQTGQQSSPATTAQMTQIAAGGTATVAAQIIAGNYVGGAGSVLLTAAPFAGPAAPFLAIAGGVAELLGAIGIGRGCGTPVSQQRHSPIRPRSFSGRTSIPTWGCLYPATNRSRPRR